MPHGTRNTDEYGGGCRVGERTDADEVEQSSWGRRLAAFYEHRATRVLVVVVAVVALPWGTWDVWTFFANRHAIDSACAGLVPAGKVTDLPYSGGRISHNPDSINLEEVSGRCMLYSTEAGDATDSSSGNDSSSAQAYTRNRARSMPRRRKTSASCSAGFLPLWAARWAAASPGR